MSTMQTEIDRVKPNLGQCPFDEPASLYAENVVHRLYRLID